MCEGMIYQTMFSPHDWIGLVLWEISFLLIYQDKRSEDWPFLSSHVSPWWRSVEHNGNILKRKVNFSTPCYQWLFSISSCSDPFEIWRSQTCPMPVIRYPVLFSSFVVKENGASTMLPRIFSFDMLLCVPYWLQWYHLWWFFCCLLLLLLLYITETVMHSAVSTSLEFLVAGTPVTANGL